MREKKIKALYTLIKLSNKAKNIEDYKLANLTFGLATIYLENFEVKEELTIDCPTCHGKKEWVDIESRTVTLCPDCNDLEPEQAMVKCDYCGRSVPISSIISASLGNSCPDCYVD